MGGMKTVSPDKTAEDFLRRHPDVTVIEALQPDMCGVLRGKRVMVRAIRSLLADGIRLPGSTCILDTTGQNIPAVPYGGADGDPDQYCRTVPGRLAPVPWAGRPMGQTLCSLFEAHGAPYFADPRHVLARAYAPLQEMGLTAVVALELEFYLLDPRPDGRGRPRPAAQPETGRRPETSQVYSLDELHDFDGFMGEVEAVCAAQALNAEAAISEYSPGQFEINLHHVANPLDACDQAVLLKRAIKGVARKHGFLASFMAKPFQELTGNGQHVHISLVDADGRNVFAPGPDGGPGETHRHAIGGLLAGMAEATAIFCPNANSYRRFLPGFFAPIAADWGVNNRAVALRVPPSGPADARIEHRVAGADANPYLVTAAVLAGIHHGMTSNTDPGPAVDGAATGTGAALPDRWEAALERFRASKTLPGYLGAEYCKTFHDARRWECDQHHAQVPRLDYDWYLRTV